MELNLQPTGQIWSAIQCTFLFITKIHWFFFLLLLLLLLFKLINKRSLADQSDHIHVYVTLTELKYAIYSVCWRKSLCLWFMFMNHSKIWVSAWRRRCWLFSAFLSKVTRRFTTKMQQQQVVKISVKYLIKISSDLIGNTLVNLYQNVKCLCILSHKFY